MLLDAHPTPVMLFTGKGGQGKTTLAAATALGLADAGRRVLLVSTDPASNLSQVLGTPVGPQPVPVPGAPGLLACDIDPELAAQAYRDRVVGPYRGVLPEVAVRAIEEGLSGACTLEVAAFDEFARLLGDAEATRGIDHVVFDTAPTGHTLRLLALPAAWSGYLDTSTAGASCLGPLAGLERQDETTRVVTRIILARLDDEALSIDKVAREMAVSTRTLQSRLAAEGVAFSDLLRDIRQRLAKQYLRQNYSVEQITYLLGFSEPSVFRKAFKKWSGVTPREYRQGAPVGA